MSEHTINQITTIIAIASFILSSTQWVYTLYCKRENYDISVEKFDLRDLGGCKRCILTLSITNLSNSPLIITRMNIGNVQCFLSHKYTGEQYYPNHAETDIPCTERFLSTDFPINIVANSGVMHRIVFDFYDKSFKLNKIFKLKVQTTNKSKTFTLYCPEECYGLMP